MRKVEFGESRAYQVFKLLDDMWQKKAGIFSKVWLPQDVYPDFDNPNDSANFLLCAILFNRGGIKVEVPVTWLLHLHQLYPEMFNSKSVAISWTLVRIQQAFEKATSDILGQSSQGQKGTGPLGFKLEEHVRNWQHNLAIIHWRFNDSPLEIFKEVEDSEQAFAKVDPFQLENKEYGFKGIRRKIFSLWVIWLQERDLIPVFPTTIPVDFHTLRILWATEIIKLTEAGPLELKGTLAEERIKKLWHLQGKTAFRVKEKIMDEIALWFMDFLKRYSFSHINLNPAIWVWSRALCSKCQQNRSFTLEDGTTGYFETQALKKNPSLWVKDYQDFCQMCGLNKWCKWAIPAKPYYTAGWLVRSGERIEYPQISLSFSSEQILRYPVKNRNRKRR